MKKRVPIYKRLNKKQRQHVAESFDGPVSKITITRIKAAIELQKKEGITCYDCNDIARTLGVMP